MHWPVLPFSISLDHPWLLLCVLPVLLLMLWRLRRKPAAAIRFSGLAYAVNAGLRTGRGRHRLRIALWLGVAVVLAVSWSAPEVRSSRPFLIGLSRELHPTFLIALDVSGSMTEPLGGDVINGELNTGGPTRFEASRQALYDFVGAHADANIGLILFSVRPMLARWPTRQARFRFRDILDEGMRYNNPDRRRHSQLSRFAGGTATRSGLAMARKVLAQQQGLTKSLILIADLIDNSDEIVDGVRALSADGVHSYVLAIDAGTENLSAVTPAFTGDPRADVFPVTSVDGLASAFARVDRLERRRQGRTANRYYVQDFRWLAALAAFVLALIAVLLFETRLHRTGKE